MPRLLFAFVTVILLLAGCSGTATKTDIVPTTSAPPPVVTAETGAISGLVTDDELLPLAKVGVIIADHENLTTETDTVGKFTLNDVPPGELSLILAKAGYETATRQVTVLAGETLDVKIGLKSLVIVKPHIEHLVDEGHIAFGAAVPSVLASGPAALGTSITHFEHPVTAGAVGIISTGVWDRSTPLTATRMGLRVEVEAEAYGEGITPLTARLFDVSVPVNETLVIDFVLTQVCTDVVGCAEDPPNRVAQVVYDQRTTIYSDVYYVTPPAPDAIAGPAP